MTFTIMKHEVTWNFVARMFHIKDPMLEEMVVSFIDTAFNGNYLVLADAHKMVYSFEDQ